MNHTSTKSKLFVDSTKNNSRLNYFHKKWKMLFLLMLTCSIIWANPGDSKPLHTSHFGDDYFTTKVSEVFDLKQVCGHGKNISRGFYAAGLIKGYTDAKYHFWSIQSGTLKEYANGTADLDMVIVNVNDYRLKFVVDVRLSGRTSRAPAGSPKLELCVGGISTSDWYYYTNTSGYLYGKNWLNGGKISISRKGPAFQIGTGGGLTNNSYGGSGWLYYQIKRQPWGGRCAFKSGANLDFNFGITPPEGTCDATIDEVVLYKSGSFQKLTELKNNGVYYLDELPQDFGLEVLTSGQVGSVRSTVNGHTITESVYHYTYPAGDQAWRPNPGRYTIKVKAYSERNGGGEKCDEKELTIEFKERKDECDGTINKLVLYRCGTDQIVEKLKDNGVYYLNELPQEFGIDAKVNGNISSVKFTVNGHRITENYAPYTYPAGGWHWSPQPGRYTIKVEAYAKDHAKGDRCDEQEITIEFKKRRDECQATIDEIILYETGSFQKLVTLRDGGVYHLEELPEKFGMEAVVNGNFGSVGFDVNGHRITENIYHFTYPNGDAVWYPRPGKYFIKVKVFSQSNQKGSKCDERYLQIEFKACDKLTHGGQISKTQKNCGGFDPAPFIGERLSHHSGKTVMYQWEIKTDKETGKWTAIPGATAKDYDPPYQESGSVWYRRKAFLADECGKPVYSNSVDIHVWETPELRLGNTRRICEGGQVTIHASVSGGKAPYQIEWSHGLGTGTSKTIQAWELSNYRNESRDFEVTVTDDKGCTATDKVRVIVLSEPDVSFVKENATCDEKNGSITFNWEDHPNRTGIEFSLNGGQSYKGVNDDSRQYTFQSLSAGVYRLLVRWGNDECPVDLGQVMIENTAEELVDGGEISKTQKQCGGFDPDTFTGEALSHPSGAAVIYQWQIKTNKETGVWSDISGATNKDYDPPFQAEGSVWYRRSATLDNECEKIVYSNTVDIHVLDLPEVAFSVIDPDCEGGNGAVTFTFPDNDGRTNIEFQILQGSTVVAAYDANSPADNTGAYTISNLTEGTYQLSVRWGNNECEVYLGEVTLSVDRTTLESGGTIGSDQRQCGGFDPEMFTGSILSPVSGLAVMYQWQYKADMNDDWMNIAGANNANYDAPAIEAGQRYYRRAARLDNECSEYVFSNTVVVEAFSAPVVSAGDDQIICEDPNIEAILTATATGTGELTYLWNTGAETAEITVQPSETTTYGVTVTDANGCSNSDEITVKVYNYITNGGRIGFNQNGCTPYDADVLTNIALPDNGDSDLDLEYIWLKTTYVEPDGTPGSEDWLNYGAWTEIPGSTNPMQLDPGVLTETTYFLRCVRRAGCVEYTGESNVVTINVGEPPVVEAGPDQEICEDPNVTAILTANGSGGTGDLSYTWSNGEETAEIMVQPIETTTYGVTVTDSFGCSDEDEVTVVVYNYITDGGRIGFTQSGCAPYQAEPLVNVTLPNNDGSDKDLEYIWLKTTYVEPDGTAGSEDWLNYGAWTEIPGSTDPMQLDPGILTETTFFLRCVRRAGCVDYTGESNVVSIWVDDPDALPVVSVEGIQKSCLNPEGELVFTFEDHPVYTGIAFQVKQNGTVIAAFADNQVGDDEGTYVIDGLEADEYEISAIYAGSECVIDLGEVNIPLIGCASIGDYVWEDVDQDGLQDLSEQGVANVLVQLLDTNSNILRQTYTNGMGYYSFHGIEPGDYYVFFEAPVGYIFTTANNGSDIIDSDANPDLKGLTPPITLTSGEFNDDIDAGLVLERCEAYCELKPVGEAFFCVNFDPGRTTYDIQATSADPSLDIVPTGFAVKYFLVDQTDAGKIIKAINTVPEFSIPVSQKEILINGPLVCSIHCIVYDEDDASANYFDISQIIEGTTTVEELAQLLADANVCSHLDETGAVFEWDYCLGRIGDTVWEDLDGDGVQEDHEPGMSNVHVVLLDENDNQLEETYTDNKGNYFFGPYRPGTYSVRFDLPTGYAFTQQNLGDDSLDSDANPNANGKTDLFTLGRFNSNLNLDAGIVAPATIGDYVWGDANGNGIQNGNESGIAGVTVFLVDANNAKNIRSTVTNSEGYYNFGNVVLGDYYVQFVLPEGYDFTTPNIGYLRNNDSDAGVDGKSAVVSLESGSVVEYLDAGLITDCNAYCELVTASQPSYCVEQYSESIYEIIATSANPADDVIPNGYQVVYLLSDLQNGDHVLKAVNEIEPRFEVSVTDKDVVTNGTQYCSIHCLIYNPLNAPAISDFLTLVAAGDSGFDTGDLTDLIEDGGLCAYLDESGATFTWEFCGNFRQEETSTVGSEFASPNMDLNVQNTADFDSDLGNGINHAGDEQTSLTLYQNAPNPFKESTKIGFVLPKEGKISLNILDLTGRSLQQINGHYPAGYNEINISRGNLPSGVLYYTLTADGKRIVKSMLVVE